jgi:hypothetical protein
LALINIQGSTISTQVTPSPVKPPLQTHVSIAAQMAFMLHAGVHAA